MMPAAAFRWGCPCASLGWRIGAWAPCRGGRHEMTAPTPPQPAPAAAPGAPHLRHALRGKDYFTLAFGSMVGGGWMLVIDDWLTRGGSVGAMLGFLVGGLILFPVGYVYGQLTAKMPDAG